jgi:lipopolysaccharide biosynthesis glycosyltransferase
MSVSLVSLLENLSKNRFVEVFILESNLSEESKFKINNTFENYNARLIFVKIEANDFSHFPLRAPIPEATYYKLLISQYLPEYISKVLYIDSDTVVMNDISDLFDIDLADFYIAAVKDFSLQNRKQILDIPEEYNYFNAGVMLMNLALFRTNRIQDKMIDFVIKNISKNEVLWFHDQDIFNAVLYDKILSLPYEYNVMSLLFKKEINNILNREDYKSIEFVKRNPIILHFTGNPKPWSYFSFHPYKEEYFRYLSKTAWYDYEMPDRSKKNFLIKIYTRHNVLAVILKRLIPLSIIKLIKSWLYK